MNQIKLNHFPYSMVVYHEDCCLILCKAEGSTEHSIVQYDDLFICTLDNAVLKYV